MKKLVDYENDPQAFPRHTGIASFFRTPIAQHASEADIAIIGVPFDGGVTHRTGARHGPRAVREQSCLLRRMNAATKREPFKNTRIRDLGDCWNEFPYELVKSLEEIETFYKEVVSCGTIPLSVGGDHSISLPILRAITDNGKNGPIGMIHIDAHCDTGDNYMGSRFHHGSPFRRAVEEGLIDPHKVIQIGIRGTTNDFNMNSFSYSSGMRVLGIDEFMDKGWLYAASEARRIVGDASIYLSYDIDSIDPSEAPGTGTPEAGGIYIREAIRMLREFRGINFIGGDLVEVSPSFDNGTLTSFNAASILFEMLCLIEQTFEFKH